MRALLVVALLGSTAAAAPCVEEVTVNGLWICGVPTAAPSHGGEDAVRNAHYTLENRGPKPIAFEVTSLEILDPQGTATPLAITAPRGAQTLAPGAKLELAILGRGALRGLQYHVRYRHRASFRVGATMTPVQASALYFRLPRTR